MLVLVGAIASAEALAMVLLPLVSGPSWVSMTLLDVLAMVLVAFPLSWSLAFRPLHRQIRERDRAELALGELNRTLEERVARRTAQLQESNEKLEAERERSERSACEANRRADELAVVLDAMAEPLLLLDADGLVRRANRAALAALELDPIGLHRGALAERIACRAPDGTPADPFALRSGDPVPRRDEPRRFSMRGAVSGRERVLDVSLSPLPGAGEPAGAITVWHDVTDRERLLEQIVAERSRLRTVIESITDAFVAYDRDWRFLALNRIAEETIFRRPADELIGKVVWELYPGSIDGPYGTAARKAVAEGKPAHFEVPSRILEGRWYEAHLYPREDGLDAYLRDITERKRAEARLEFLASFPELNPNPVVEVDLAAQRVSYANPAARRTMPDLPDGGLEHPWLSGVEPIAAALLATGGSATSREVRVGSSWHSQTLNLVPPGGLLRIYAVDVTRRVEAVAEEKRRTAELRQLNRTLNALSRSSLALSRATDEQDYLNEVCSIVVEDCGHAMVWIGWAEDDEAKSVRVAASAGFEEGYLESLKVTWADTERGRGPTGTAIRTGAWVECRDMTSDPRFLPWREKALERGYASSVAIPLLEGDRALGAITIYSREREAFGEDEIRLLSELAGNLAYGVSALRLRAAHARAQEELRESEQRFRLALANAPVSVAALDRDLRFIWAFNQKTVRSEDVVGRTDGEIFPPEDAARLVAMKRRVLAEGVEARERLWVTSNGRRVFLDLFLRPLRDAGGRITGVGIATVDLTEIELQKEALQKSEAVLRGILDATQESIWLFGPGGSFLLANDIALRRLGCTREEVVGRTVSEALPPALAESRWAHIRQVFEGGQPVEFEDERAGMVFTHSMYPVFDPAGQVVSVASFSRDVTQARRSVEALRVSEERFRAVASNTPDHVVVQDLALRYTMVVNPQLGLREEEMIGKTDDDLLPPADAARLTAIKRRVLESGETLHLETSLPDVTGGAQVFDGAYVPSRNARGEVDGLVGYFRNVTERRRMEQTLRELNAELEQKVRERTAQLLELNRSLLALSRSLELDTVLETLLERLRPLVPFDRAQVCLVEPDGRLAIHATFRDGRVAHLPAGERPVYEPHEEPVLQSVLDDAVAKVIPDLGSDPDWNPGAGGLAEGSWLGMPLVGRDGVLGLLSLSRREANSFPPDLVRIAEALFAQASVSVQNAIFFEQIQAAHERLRALSRRLVEVQENERRSVARELHDDAGQVLASLRLGLQALEREAPGNQVVQARVAELKKTTDEVLESLHRLAADLRPASLDKLGLEAAIAQHVTTAGRKSGLEIGYRSVGLEGQRFPPEVETALYRTVQEALTNVLRHAGAAHVAVLVERRDDRVIVVVEDDGRGFDPERVRGSQRLGLVGMRERAETLGGTLTVETAPGAGTTVVVDVPCPDSCLAS